MSSGRWRERRLVGYPAQSTDRVGTTAVGLAVNCGASANSPYLNR